MYIHTCVFVYIYIYMNFTCIICSLQCWPRLSARAVFCAALSSHRLNTNNSNEHNNNNDNDNNDNNDNSDSRHMNDSNNSKLTAGSMTFQMAVAIGSSYGLPIEAYKLTVNCHIPPTPWNSGFPTGGGISLVWRWTRDRDGCFFSSGPRSPMLPWVLAASRDLRRSHAPDVRGVVLSPREGRRVIWYNVTYCNII